MKLKCCYISHKKVAVPFISAAPAANWYGRKMQKMKQAKRLMQGEGERVE